MGVKLFKRYIKLVGSQLPNSKYTDTSSEQLADNFSARFGYGRDLITGLDKIHTKYSTDRNNTMYYTTTIIDYISLLAVPIVLIAVLISSVPLGVLLGVFYTTLIYLNGSANLDMTYDSVFSRYERIKHELVAMLKDSEMTKEQQVYYIKQIDEIETILEGTKQYKSVFTSISDFVFSANSKANEQVLLEKTLERLAHNELFTMSARLNTI
jgi:hypothetical protein